MVGREGRDRRRRRTGDARPWWAALAAALLAACGASGGRPSPPPPPCAPGSPGAPWLAFSSLRSGNYEIWRARADGSCLAQVTDDPGMDLDPSWSRSALAFASDRRGALGLWLHDLATGEETAVETAGLASATQPAFSPDGTRLAFEGRAGTGTADVYVVPASGGAPVALTTDPADDAGPAWSPDGRTVYFVSTRSGVHDVWSVPAAGGDPEQVTTRSGIIGKPAVTPDGAALLYARGAVSGRSEVVRRELATGLVTVVTSADDSEPALAPSGRLVAVRSYRAGHADLVVVWLDGAPAVALTDDDASDGAPAFAPSP
jgi:TolB protein